jgi:hypothetical protein
MGVKGGNISKEGAVQVIGTYKVDALSLSSSWRQCCGRLQPRVGSKVRPRRRTGDGETDVSRGDSGSGGLVATM